MANTRIHLSLNSDLLKAVNLFIMQEEDLDGNTVSNIVNIAIKSYLDDPFKWKDYKMYTKAFPKGDDVDED